MYNFTKIYGETVIEHKDEDEEEIRTIKLKYYQTKDRKFSKRKYGVGIIRTEIGSNELNEEKQEYNHICEQKEEVEKLLNMLLKNKVTPIDLKYVLEDLAIE